jgi:hypothetical protein
MTTHRSTPTRSNDMFGAVSRPRTNQPGPRWMTSFSQKVATAYFDTLLVDKNPDAVR